MNSRSEISDKLIWIFIALYYAAIYIAEDMSGESGLGKYILLAPLLLMLYVSFAKVCGKLFFNICSYDIYLVAFFLFCYLSSIWAKKPVYATSKAVDTLEVAIAMYCFRLCLPQENRVKNLLKAWMWGGYIVVLYCLFQYGLNYWIDAAADELRMDSETINANSLGMTAAYSIVISLYFLLYDGVHLDILFALPALLVLAVSQSRKSILILVLGVAAVLVFKAGGRLLANRKDVLRVLRFFIRTTLILAVFALIVFQVSKLPMFEGINSRLQLMLNGMTGNGDAGESYDIRAIMRQIGVQLFKNNPWIGVGIDNACVYTERVFGVKRYYLHNNYVELLADGGIVGFSVYYWIYAVLLFKFWKYKDFSSGEFYIVSLLLILRLVLDYGCVSYETKSTYYQLLIFYLEAEKLKHLNSAQIHIIPAFWRKGARQ